MLQRLQDGALGLLRARAARRPAPRPAAARARPRGSRAPPGRAGRRSPRRPRTRRRPRRPRSRPGARRSPHDAQPASCGAKPAASSSLRRKASALARVARDGLAVEQRELVGEQVVDAGVRVAVVEHARHGLAGAGGAVERAGVLAQARVGGHRLGAGDGQQLAAALVEHEVEPEERLQPAAEARARAAHALGDRADSVRDPGYRGAGCGRPLRSGGCGGRSLRSLRNQPRYTL